MKNTYQHNQLNSIYRLFEILENPKQADRKFIGKT